jgi:hypothetical protein
VGLVREVRLACAVLKGRASMPLSGGFGPKRGTTPWELVGNNCKPVFADHAVDYSQMGVPGSFAFETKQTSRAVFFVIARVSLVYFWV